MISQIDAVLLDVGGVFFLPRWEPIASVLSPFGVPDDPAVYDRAHYAGVAAMEW